MVIITKVESLRKTRVKAGYNIKELSRITGIPHSTISCIENERKHPTPAVTKKICDALKVEFDDLFEIKEGD